MTGRPLVAVFITVVPVLRIIVSGVHPQVGFFTLGHELRADRSDKSNDA